MLLYYKGLGNLLWSFQALIGGYTYNLASTAATIVHKQENQINLVPSINQWKYLSKHISESYLHKREEAYTTAGGDNTN